MRGCCLRVSIWAFLRPSTRAFIRFPSRISPRVSKRVFSIWIVNTRIIYKGYHCDLFWAAYVGCHTGCIQGVPPQPWKPQRGSVAVEDGLPNCNIMIRTWINKVYSDLLGLGLLKACLNRVGSVF